MLQTLKGAATEIVSGQRFTFYPGNHVGASRLQSRAVKPLHIQSDLGVEHLITCSLLYPQAIIQIQWMLERFDKKVDSTARCEMVCCSNQELSSLFCSLERLQLSVHTHHLRVHNSLCPRQFQRTLQTMHSPVQCGARCEFQQRPENAYHDT